MAQPPEERAARFGFLSAEAGIAREKNPYLKLLIETRRSDGKLWQSTQLLAAAWWDGWDRGAATTPRGLESRRAALAAVGVRALDGSPSIE